MSRAFEHPSVTSDYQYLKELKQSSAYCDGLRKTAPCQYKPQFYRRPVKGGLEIANLIARFVKDNGGRGDNRAHYRVSLTASDRSCVPVHRTYWYDCCLEAFVIVDHDHGNETRRVNHSYFITDIQQVLLSVQTDHSIEIGGFTRHELRFYTDRNIQVDHYPIRHIEVSPLHEYTSELQTRDRCSTTIFNSLCGDI